MLVADRQSFAVTRQLSGHLARLEIAHTIAGSAAVRAYGARPMREVVEVLMTADSLERFRSRLGDDYVPTLQRQGRRFLDRTTGMKVHVLVSGHCPGPRQPGAIEYPNPTQAAVVIDGVPYLSLLWLVQVKLARRCFYDLADVVSLIRSNRLDETYLSRLDSSARNDFANCFEEIRRDDEFDALEGRA